MGRPALTSIHIQYLIIVLITLIILSAFFSGAETGMMAVNRYRLRHLARKNNPAAKRVISLLKRPDRLLGTILIGNTFTNIFASAVTTIIAVRYFDNTGVFVLTLILAMVILIFGETAPKTFAAVHPQRAAFSVSLPLKLLLIIFYPLVWLVNGIANGLLRLFGVRVNQTTVEPLNAEELRTIVREATGKISSSYQQMLLRVLSLGQVTVEDVMVPRSQIDGIDILDNWDNILKILSTTEHTHLPIYRESIDHVIGMLNTKKLMQVIYHGELSRDKLVKMTTEIYFVPGVTLLNHQLLNFQREHKTIGLVVDEYGDIQGMVTLQDIVEEIVGEFALDVEDTLRLIRQESDGSYNVDGRISVRDLNRITNWNFPTDGPKTLSGLIIEYLEIIPTAGVALRLAGCAMEIVKVSRNTVRIVKIWPNQAQKKSTIESME